MMRNILLLVGAMLFAGAALAQPPAASGPQPHDLPEGRARAVVQTVCAQCHSIDVVVRQPRSRDEWVDVMSRMIGNGAQLSDAEYGMVVDYLVTHYGPAADGSRRK